MSDISNTLFSPQWLQNKRILIVEDESSNFELLKAMLRKSEAEITWSQNGTDAIEQCRSNSFHLILMDIKMPEMNGYEAVSQIRALGVKTPVIAQTAYARVEDENKILSKGFDDYISKPIDRKRLFQLIDELIPH
jgi:CheY-like chemotaxis protein